ncbi:MAG: hypothetical protein K2P76_08740 [Lachnospiraceae bacterium]|nr:hypothetical protein [Lachnospiraceae bacterium]MDE6982489.1 hypothetical protein [Lachnospiraceae bacterium]
MSKKFTAILFSILIFSAGCGKNKELAQDTKTAPIQETEYVEYREQTEETQQDIDENPKEERVASVSVKMNPDTKSVYIEALFSTEEKVDENEYFLEGIQVLRTESQQTPEGGLVRWYGFYQEEDACRNIKIGKPFEKNPFIEVESKVSVEEIDAKKFEVQAGSGTVPVWMTPFSVFINPSEDWRGEGEFYSVSAVDSRDTRKYLCSLPMMDDRKPSQQKEFPLENSQADELELLGGGISSAVELEHCGMQSVFYEEIDLNSIQKVEISCFHK